MLLETCMDYITSKFMICVDLNNWNRDLECRIDTLNTWLFIGIKGITEQHAINNYYRDNLENYYLVDPANPNCFDELDKVIIRYVS